MTSLEQLTTEQPNPEPPVNQSRLASVRSRFSGFTKLELTLGVAGATLATIVVRELATNPDNDNWLIFATAILAKYALLTGAERVDRRVNDRE